MSNGYTNSEGPKEVKKINPEEYDRILKDFSGHKDQGGLGLFVPGDYVLPMSFNKFKHHVYNFQFREDDVLIMTYPKSGTTWTQEVVWTMRHNPDLDNPQAAEPGRLRIPFIESDMLFDKLKEGPMKEAFDALCPGKDPNDGMALQLAENIPEKRVVKTHLPPSFFDPSLLDTCKVVFVSRNPKDVILSFHHHSKMAKLINYSGSYDEYVNYFINDKVIYSPFWETFHEIMKYSDHPNLMIIKYEEMIADPLKAIQGLDKFMKCGLSIVQMNKIAHYTSFNEMKKRADSLLPHSLMNVEVVEKDGGFFRQGKSGKGKEVLNEEQKTKIDIWIKKNTIGRQEELSKIVNY